MKIHVVTDRAGRVLGTAPAASAEGQPTVRLLAGEGQQLHEVELTAEMDSAATAEALHAALQAHLST
jgi:hypothetical protein